MSQKDAPAGWGWLRPYLFVTSNLKERSVLCFRVRKTMAVGSVPSMGRHSTGTRLWPLVLLINKPSGSESVPL